MSAGPWAGSRARGSSCVACALCTGWAGQAGPESGSPGSGLPWVWALLFSLCPHVVRVLGSRGREVLRGGGQCPSSPSPAGCRPWRRPLPEAGAPESPAFSPATAWPAARSLCPHHLASGVWSCFPRAVSQQETPEQVMGWVWPGTPPWGHGSDSPQRPCQRAAAASRLQPMPSADALVTTPSRCVLPGWDGEHPVTVPQLFPWAPTLDGQGTGVRDLSGGRDQVTGTVLVGGAGWQVMLKQGRLRTTAAPLPRPGLCSRGPGSRTGRDGKGPLGGAGAEEQAGSLKV